MNKYVSVETMVYTREEFTQPDLILDNVPHGVFIKHTIVDNVRSDVFNRRGHVDNRPNNRRKECIYHANTYVIG